MDWRSRRRRSSSCQCSRASYCDGRGRVSSASWISRRRLCRRGDWRRAASAQKRRAFVHGLMLYLSHLLMFLTSPGLLPSQSVGRQFVPYLQCWSSQCPGYQRTSCGAPFALSCPYDSEKTHRPQEWKEERGLLSTPTNLPHIETSKNTHTRLHASAHRRLPSSVCGGGVVCPAKESWSAPWDG